MIGNCKNRISIVFFVILLCSSVYASLVPVADAAEPNIQAKSLSFLSDAVGIKTEQYTVSDSLGRTAQNLGAQQKECNQAMSALFKTLKETAARPVEALRMQWDDLDIGNKKLSINHPAKGSNARIRPISTQLLNMLQALPRKDKRIFPYKSTQSAGRSFRKMRKKAIIKLGNQELSKIDFYTCRYWRATAEYHKTHDFGAVMVLLGHTSLRYVLLYAQLSETYFGDAGYVCKEAFSRQDAMKLIELGFEYVLTDKEGVSLFRKTN